jgi:hypothetical protein
VLAQQRLQPRPLRIRQIMPLQPRIIHGPIQAAKLIKICETRSSRTRRANGAGPADAPAAPAGSAQLTAPAGRLRR